MIHVALNDARHDIHHEADDMEHSVTEQEDGSSDYGSDFNPDEEDLLKSLLQQPPSEADNPIADPDLRLKDFKDDFTPKSARVSKLAYESRLSPTAAKEKLLAMQKVGDRGNSPICMSAQPQVSSTD